MELARGTLEDVIAIAQIHVSAWQAAYAGIVPAEYLAGMSIANRQARWRDAISEGKPETVVAKVGGEVVGWIAYGPCRDEGANSTAGEVWAIYVASAHWSRGVGRALWLHARARLVQQGFKTISLWVLIENKRAIRFYLAAGFLPEAESIKEIVLAGKSLQEGRYVVEIEA